MTKQTKIRSVFLALALACGIAAPAAAALSSGSVGPRPGAPLEKAGPVALPDVPRPPAVVDLPEVRIAVTAARKAAPARRKAPAKPARCRLHELEQGGSPSAPFVLVCG